MSDAKHTPTPQKLSAKWFEDFAVVSEDGEIEDWPEVARKLIEHADACKIDEAQLESAGEEIERLRNAHDALVAVLNELLPDLNWGTVGRWKAGTPDNMRLLAALKLARGES